MVVVVFAQRRIGRSKLRWLRSPRAGICGEFLNDKQSTLEIISMSQGPDSLGRARTNALGLDNSRAQQAGRLTRF